MKGKNCRETHSLLKRFISFLEEHANSGPVLGSAILTCLPAVFSGCHQPDQLTGAMGNETVINIKKVSNDIATQGPVDILIFDGNTGRLNTYQRIERPDSWQLKASSSEGQMLFTVLSNAQKEAYEWTEICSREGLENLTVNLENESRAQPSMSGECTGYSGSTLDLSLKRTTAEICLRKISCDFISKAYSGCDIEEPKIYLVNVNAETPIMGNGSSNAQRIINTGRLNHDDLAKFRDPGIIYQELNQPIGRNTISPDIRLISYPNHIETESAGTPVTRLVLEGSLRGKTYFWPININMKGNGIEGNCIYTFEIHISRPGTSDPDIPVELGEGELIMEVERWNEMEEYGVYF